MDEMSHADAESVAVAAGHHHVKVGIAELHAGRDRNGASVQAVETVGTDESGKVGGAANTGHNHQVFGLNGKVGGGLLKGA